MTADQSTTFRDPMKRGAPIIPRTGWMFAPYNRWTFQNVREMTPTAKIWRGPGPVAQLPERKQDLDGIEFDFAGRRRTVGDFLKGSFTSGFLVLSQGEIVMERYMNGFAPHGQHLAMSVSKSVTATVCGILVHRGLIDPAAPVTRYLPELDATAYRGATVQHVLDMMSGVHFDETYDSPDSDIQKLDEVSGWKPLSHPDGPQTIWQFILTLTKQDQPHGQVFNYRSIETDVLGLIMERASGRRLAELISEELWVPMGAGEDAYITVDRAGTALADGGFNAALRDFGRFALLHLRNGKANGRQIVPRDWIEDTRFGNHGGALDAEIYQLPNGTYRNQFWIEDATKGTYMCLGIHGQHIYLDPAADFAVVKLSTWPEALSMDYFKESLAAIHAIRNFCTGCR
ncbi:MAG: class C beta-lactamase-related serine hydrolase [Rhodospirillaceae bacterium]|nr:MAG: class C beta-lactamase-related serine hydrolase [Rhodospirillaceae bacterium]